MKRLAALTIQCLNASTFLSWQFFPNRLRQQNLSEQQTARAHDADGKQIAILLILFHAHGRFLNLVDVLINLFERLRVGSTIELSVCNFRHLLQPGFVEFDAPSLIKNVPCHVGKWPSLSKDRDG